MKCLVGEILSKFWPSIDGCWNFTGGKTGDGYGVISFDKFTQKGAHVIAHELYKGPVPKGAFVLHSCDNPSCVNPDHLTIGTLQTNKDDEVSKGRHVHGITHGMARLVEDDIRQIRKLLSRNRPLSEIGNQFGVTRQNIWRIKHGLTWGHVQ